MTMKLRYLILILLPVAAAMGCSTTQPGTPVAESAHLGLPSIESADSANEAPLAQVSPASQPEPALAAIQPCGLVTAAEASSFSLPAQGFPQDLPSLRQCDWTNLDGDGFAIAINDDIGLDELNLRGVTSDVVIGRHRAKRELESGGPGFCKVVFAISDTSSVNLLALYPNDTPQACAVADQIAALIEPRLP